MAVDTCNPQPSVSLNTFRFWSIVFPVIGLIFMGECVFVFMSIPDVVGSALTITGKTKTT